MTDTLIALGVVFLAALYLVLRLRRLWWRREAGGNSCGACPTGCSSAGGLEAYLREHGDGHEQPSS